MKTELSPLKAWEKVNHTVCLNINNKTLIFGLDEYDECDCKDMDEFCYCCSIIETTLKNHMKNEEIRYLLSGGRMAGKTAKIRSLAKIETFDIIKEKGVNTLYIKECDNVKEYNILIKGQYGIKQLTESEFRSLKEAFKLC